MINFLRDVKDLESFKKSYSNQTILCAASIRGMPISIMKAFESEEVTFILPIIFVKGIEFDGPTEREYLLQWLTLKYKIKELYGNSKTLYEPILYSNVNLWQLFNVKYANTLRDKYGFSNICLTCKSYFTIVQIHIASILNMPILIGEKPNKDKTKFQYDLIRMDRLVQNDKSLFTEFKINRISLINNATLFEDIKYLFPEDWFYLPNSTCLFEESWKILHRKNKKSDFPHSIVDEYITPLSSEIIKSLNKNFLLSKTEMDSIIKSFVEATHDYQLRC